MTDKLTEEEAKTLKGWYDLYKINSKEGGVDVSYKTVGGAMLSKSTIEKGLAPKTSAPMTVRSAKLLCKRIGMSFDDLRPPNITPAVRPRHPEPTLYSNLRTCFDLPDQTLSSSYLGNYICFRKSSAEGGLVEGSINIFRSPDQSFGFTHKSKQKIDVGGTRVEEFDHEGHFFVLSNRLYFIGLGTDSYGSYLRPIIAGAVDRPEKREIVGIILLETVHHVPLACKTAIIHVELEKRLREKYPIKTEFDVYIISLLVNESKIPDVIYGWNRSDK